MLIYYICVFKTVMWFFGCCWSFLITLTNEVPKLFGRPRIFSPHPWNGATAEFTSSLHAVAVPLSVDNYIWNFEYFFNETNRNNVLYKIKMFSGAACCGFSLTSQCRLVDVLIHFHRQRSNPRSFGPLVRS